MTGFQRALVVLSVLVVWGLFLSGVLPVTYAVPGPFGYSSRIDAPATLIYVALLVLSVGAVGYAIPTPSHKALRQVPAYILRLPRGLRLVAGSTLIAGGSLVWEELDFVS